MPLRAAGISTPLNEIKAELFKALAHPVRVRVLELLVDGERPVSDLLAETAIEASNLSQQLAVLRRSGVVGTRREGNTVYYRLADPTLCDLLAAARAFLITMLAQTRDLLAGLEAGAGR